MKSSSTSFISSHVKATLSEPVLTYALLKSTGRILINFASEEDPSGSDVEMSWVWRRQKWKQGNHIKVFTVAIAIGQVVKEMKDAQSLGLH